MAVDSHEDEGGRLEILGYVVLPRIGVGLLRWEELLALCSDI